MLAAAGEHDKAHALILGKAAEQSVKLAEHHCIKRISAVGAVERDLGNAPRR